MILMSARRASALSAGLDNIAIMLIAKPMSVPIITR